MEEKILVMVTTGSEEEAVKIARVLLDERLIACANLIGKIRSLYHWKGEICDDPEVLLLCKSQGHLFDRISEKVTSVHSYEVPEIVALPLIKGFEPYFQWLVEETSGPQSARSEGA